MEANDCNYFFRLLLLLLRLTKHFIRTKFVSSHTNLYPFTYLDMQPNYGALTDSRDIVKTDLAPNMPKS